MPRLVWIIAGILSTVILLALLGISLYLRSGELAQSRAELSEARGGISNAQTAAAAIQKSLDEAQDRVKVLEKEKEEVVQTRKTLEEEMRAALESKDVTISKLQGKLTVSILDHVLFDSGEADLKPEGEAVLTKVAAILAQHPELKIHVIGHTDNVPIRASARARFPSNWELSTGRATAAVRFLTERAGVDPTRLGAVGYGEFRPVADNSTPEGRARNRRIAITILSEELVGADSKPTTDAQRSPATTSDSPGPGGVVAPGRLPLPDLTL
jgi:chemotaxis protein MotB